MNTLGIENNLDRPRIAKLLRFGIVGTLLVLIGDFLLGWAPVEGAEGALEVLVAPALSLPRECVIAGMLLGVVGLPIQALSYFGVYRLMADAAPGLAHFFRAGIFGYLAFGPLVHAATGACVLVYQDMYASDPALALSLAGDVFWWILVPSSALMFVSALPLVISQIRAFAGGFTPYPRWAAVFNMALGALVFMTIGVIGAPAAWANGLGTAGVSFGNLLAFAGLLATLPKELVRPGLS